MVKITKINNKKIAVKGNSFLYDKQELNKEDIISVVNNRFDYVLQGTSLKIFKRSNKHLKKIEFIINQLIDEKPYRMEKIVLYKKFDFVKSLCDQKESLSKLIDSICKNESNLNERYSDVLNYLNEKKKQQKKRNQVISSLVHQKLVVKSECSIINLNNDFLNRYIMKLFEINNGAIKETDTLKNLEFEIKIIIMHLLEFVDLSNNLNVIKVNLSTNKKKLLEGKMNDNKELINFVYKYLYKHIIQIKSKKKNYTLKKLNNRQIEREIIAKIRNNVHLKLLNLGKGIYYFFDETQSPSSFSYQVINATDVFYMSVSRSYNQALFAIYSKITNAELKQQDIINNCENRLVYSDTGIHNYFHEIYGVNSNLELFTSEVLSALNFIRNNIGHYIKIADPLKSNLDFLRKVYNLEICNFKKVIEQNFISNDVLNHYSEETIQTIVKDIYSNSKQNSPYIPAFHAIRKQILLIKPELISNSSILFLLKEFYYYNFPNQFINLEEIIKQLQLSNDKTDIIELFYDVIADCKNLIELSIKIQEEKLRCLANGKNSDFLDINFHKFIAFTFLKFIQTEYNYIYDQTEQITPTSRFSEYCIPSPKMKDHNDNLCFYALIKLLSPREVSLLKGELLKFNQYYNKILLESKVIENNLSEFLPDIAFFKNNITEFVCICDLVIASNSFYLQTFKMKKDQEGSQQLTSSEIKSKFYTFSDLIKHSVSDIFYEQQKLDLLELKEKIILDTKFMTEQQLDDWLKYVQLKNKLEGYDDIKLSYLLSDLYSQLFSWIFLIERDLEYYLLAKEYIANKEEQSILEMRAKLMTPRTARKIFSNSFKEDDFLKKQFFLYNTELQKDQKTIDYLDECNYIDKLGYLFIRNYIMHYDIISKSKNPFVSIMKIYSLFFSQFFNYDRKLRNNVLPRLKSIFENYDLELTIKMEVNNSFQITEVKSKKNCFLVGENTKKLEKDILSKEFVERIKRYLSLSSNYQSKEEKITQ